MTILYMYTSYYYYSGTSGGNTQLDCTLVEDPLTDIVKLGDISFLISEATTFQVFLNK